MERIRQLIREVIPVIIGVLIALVINNWNEDRKTKKYLSQIFFSIQKELEESESYISQAIPKQKVLLDSIGEYLNDQSVSLLEVVKKTEGIKFSTIKNNSWQSISRSKIELISHDKLSMLSDIDESKKELYLKNEKVFDFVIDNANAMDSGKKELFELMIQDIIWTEERLQKQIDEFIEKMKPIVSD